MSPSHGAAVMSNKTSSHDAALSARLGHLTVRADDQLPEVHFLFERQDKRIGGALGASVLGHATVVLIMVLVARMVPEANPRADLPERLPHDIVWLAEPGPGGGGGGGGNKMQAPPKKAELPGKDALTVPVVKKAVPEMTEPKPEEPTPEQTLIIPAKSMAAAATASPGVLESNQASDGVSQGSGTGGGAGTGTGSGLGSGQGSGLGPGYGGGTGGGAYRPGNGVDIPRLIRDVKPQYTADAMRAKIQGVVLLECIVLPDGSVGDVKVKRSLDPTFGLDQEAVKAARQWRFIPGMRLGEPVAVIVSIELSFSLR